MKIESYTLAALPKSMRRHNGRTIQNTSKSILSTRTTAKQSDALTRGNARAASVAATVTTQYRLQGNNMKSLIELQNAVLIALSKIDGDRDALQDGSAYSIDADISGKIDGQAFNMPLVATLTVGHETDRATSATPDVTAIIARLLSKMNAKTQASVLDELQTELALHGKIEATAEQKATVEEFTKSLRQSKVISVRGSVKLNSATKKHNVNFVE